MAILPSNNYRPDDRAGRDPSDVAPGPPMDSRMIRVYLTMLAVFLVVALLLLGGWVVELVTGTGDYDQSGLGTTELRR